MENKKNYFTNSIEDCLMLAEGGDASHQLVLAFRFAEAIGTPTDIGKSLNWRRKAIKQKNLASIIFHMIYDHQESQPMRKKMAENYAQKYFEDEQKSAEVSIVLYALGCIYQDEKNEKAINVLNNSIALGNPAAYTNMGLAYLDGKHVEKDTKKALENFEKALEMGHNNAIVHLYKMYRDGNGVDKNPEKAKEYILKGIERGNSMAYFEYLKDNVTDNSLLEKLINSASDKNHLCCLAKISLYLLQTSKLENKLERFDKIIEAFSERRYSFGLFYPVYINNILQEDKKTLIKQEKIIEYLKIASEFGSPDAKRELGLIYEKGTGVTKDFKEAARLYQEAIESGDFSCYKYLAHLYDTGEGVDKDTKKSLDLLTTAASFYCSFSTIILAHKYLDGFGSEKDPKKAFDILRVTYENGDPNSAAVIAKMYKEGKGVKQNTTKAKQILEFAKKKDALPHFTNFTI
eukprot:TRINITY_DN16958_c0_g1_i1.p1 TRINITY_DN16958_c0_g1~~TRINITY_DN16958_c0_g1_i1.p1  ORF type:complete len:461 (+),score=146.00 TRINITY_DN16958_c0_g1_i1:32-1414(+)